MDLFTLLIFASVILYQSSGEKCHISGKPTNNKYATKTPYQYIVDELDQDWRPNEGTCENVQYWSVIRHGTRYPSEKAIQMMTVGARELQAKILASQAASGLCQEDVRLFEEWDLEVDPELAKDLHDEGMEELIYMGERLFDRYPELFNDYHEQDFIFRPTHKQRAMLSGSSLALGLFSRPVASKVKFEQPVTPHDPLIRFYKLCDKWIRTVKKNSSAKAEFFKFSRSKFVDDVRKNISSLLGFDTVITTVELETIYVTCNFDQAWRPRVASPWCGLFSDLGLEVMEYMEDLEYYWTDGPGHEISWRPACVLMSDLQANFVNVTRGAREERGIFYFTHSGTILKFLAYLKTHNDPEHLTSDNFLQMLDRKWRTSKIGPFAANVSFLLQKCDLVGHVVCLFVNERLTAVPGCGEGCCPWEDFRDIFRDSVENCDFNAMCADDNGLNSEEDDDLDMSVPDDRF